MIKRKYDVIIIGAGVGGLSAAKTLLNSGFSVLLIEKAVIGGTTIHGGGAFINHIFQTLKLYHKIEHLNDWSIAGDTTTVKIDFDQLFHSYKQNKQAAITRYKATLFRDNLDYVEGEACLNGLHRVVVNHEEYEGRYIILAHGSRLRQPNFVGLKQAIKEGFVIDPIQISELDKAPHHVAVLGEGRIAFEEAEMLSRLGVKVTLISSKQYMLRRIDQDARDLIIKNLIDTGVEVIDEYDEIIFESHTIRVTKAQQTTIVRPQYCILAMGYVVDDSLFGPVVIQTNKEGISTNEFCQSSINHIYAIGDANDKLKLSNVAIKEGQIAANHILGRQMGIDYNGFVSGIMGVYEYSCLGLTEEVIREKGIPYFPYSLTLDSNHDFNFTKTPLLKVFISKITHEILGIHLLGENGSEQMTQLLTLLKPPSAFKTMNIPVQSRLQKIKDELDAIRNKLVADLIDNALEFHYQAIYDNQSRQIVGYESLSRFVIDQRIELPLPIIQMLEESGKISQLDFKQIEYAGLTLKRLNEQGVDTENISFFVNISSNTIISEEAEKFVLAAQKHQCPIKNIVLEITERQVINNPRILHTLQALKTYGFRIGLDDFSIGHASLSLLAKFHFDKVKLDRDLLPENDKDYIRIKSFTDLIELLKVYDVTLVAEGIETAFQSAFIKKLGVKLLQGYFFHRPQRIK